MVAVSTMFTPSSWRLEKMLEVADAKFRAAQEQDRLRKEAADEARMERFLIAQAKAKQWRRMCER